MCIIVFKDSKVAAPSKDIVKTCFQNNPDGAGLAILRKDIVEIHKGFMSLNTYQQFIDTHVLPNDTAIYHFRIGTSGGNTPQNTHPFPISDKIDDLKALSLTSRFAFIHNGILGQGTKSLSDTQLFVKDVLFKMRDKLAKHSIKKRLEALTQGSRTVTIDAKHHIIIKTGQWITDSKTGLEFSNTTYKHSYHWPEYWGRSFDDYEGYEEDYPICPSCGEEFSIDYISERHDLYECRTCGCLYDGTSNVWAN